MGKCINCGKEINLKEGEVNCPSCGQPPYKCWNCNENITGETKECSVCNFFICPSCGCCGKECKIQEILIGVRFLNDRKKIEYIYKTIKELQEILKVWELQESKQSSKGDKK